MRCCRIIFAPVDEYFFLFLLLILNLLKLRGKGCFQVDSALLQRYYNKLSHESVKTIISNNEQTMLKIIKKKQLIVFLTAIYLQVLDQLKLEPSCVELNFLFTFRR